MLGQQPPPRLESSNPFLPSSNIKSTPEISTPTESQTAVIGITQMTLIHVRVSIHVNHGKITSRIFTGPNPVYPKSHGLESVQFNIMYMDT
jgi:hypothetical protein